MFQQHVHPFGWCWYRELITFNAEHLQKILATCTVSVTELYLMEFLNYYLLTYFFVQDCRVVIWTKNEVGGGSWTSKVIKTKMCF